MFNYEIKHEPGGTNTNADYLAGYPPIPSELTLLDVTKKFRVGAISVSMGQTVLYDTGPVTTLPTYSPTRVV